MPPLWQGAANISNQTIDIVALTKDFGMENFTPGYLGTPVSGASGLRSLHSSYSGGRHTDCDGQDDFSCLFGPYVRCR